MTQILARHQTTRHQTMSRDYRTARRARFRAAMLQAGIEDREDAGRADPRTEHLCHGGSQIVPVRYD